MAILKIISTTIYLLFCLLINIPYFTDLEVYPGPLRFFIRASKILMRLGVLFLMDFTMKMFLLCSYFSMKNAYLKPAKSGRSSACSTHLLVSDWCSTIDVVCICQVIILKVRIKIIDFAVFCTWTSYSQNVLNFLFFPISVLKVH